MSKKRRGRTIMDADWLPVEKRAQMRKDLMMDEIRTEAERLADTILAERISPAGRKRYIHELRAAHPNQTAKSLFKLATKSVIGDMSLKTFENILSEK